MVVVRGRFKLQESPLTLLMVIARLVINCLRFLNTYYDIDPPQFQQQNINQVSCWFKRMLNVQHLSYCVILLIYDMEDEVSRMVRRSKILTTHGLKSSSSVPSLPLIVTSRSSSPQTLKNLSHFSAKGRSQLQKQARIRQLSLLRINLSKQHESKAQIKQEVICSKECLEEPYASSIENKLTNIMSLLSNSAPIVPVKIIDKDRAEFVSRCEQIAEVHRLAAKEQNMRYKNKIISIILTMKSKQSLLALFEAIGSNSHSYNELYIRYQNQFLSLNCIFRKNLKSLSLHCGYLIDNYRQNRYRYLNEDIQRIKSQIKEEGETISARLKDIDNLKIRNGIFRSLKSVDLGCLANRGLYQQLTERLRNSQL